MTLLKISVCFNKEPIQISREKEKIFCGNDICLNYRTINNILATDANMLGKFVPLEKDNMQRCSIYTSQHKKAIKIKNVHISQNTTH